MTIESGFKYGHSGFSPDWYWLCIGRLTAVRFTALNSPACLMPTLTGWPTAAVAPMMNGFSSSEFDVIELPILLPEWQVNALEAAARERGMTIGQLLRRLFSDLFPEKRPV